MADRSSARIFAPLALVAGVIAIVVVIGVSGSSSPPPSRPAAEPVSHGRAHPAKPPPRSYVVKPGDTLTAIADRTGVSIGLLESLNPGVDPQALHTGARLKLVP